ncbi:MAG: transcriptional repressor NrdR [Candidatus Aenigmarchaeota archaeon]|nr:transcriptional repressor NrdR [Candidatus Aenigmarchaeota archaeon]
MKCPFCGHEETKVTDKRDAESLTRRRRECEKCEKRFTTYEKPEISMTVIKKDGSREPYDREKLRTGMMKSCEKRAISPESIEESVSEIESRLLKMPGEIDSSAIGELVLKKLLKLDKVAYLRFASVHRSFEDVERFEKEVRLIKSR